MFSDKCLKKWCFLSATRLDRRRPASGIWVLDACFGGELAGESRVAACNPRCPQMCEANPSAFSDIRRDCRASAADFRRSALNFVNVRQGYRTVKTVGSQPL